MLHSWSRDLPWWVGLFSNYFGSRGWAKDAKICILCGRTCCFRFLRDARRLKYLCICFYNCYYWNWARHWTFVFEGRGSCSSMCVRCAKPRTRFLFGFARCGHTGNHRQVRIFLYCYDPFPDSSVVRTNRNRRILICWCWLWPKSNIVPTLGLAKV